MKKFLSLTLALALTFVLASCTAKNDVDENVKGDVVTEDNVGEDAKNENNTDSVVYENADLLALADSLYVSFNADELPMLGSMEISAEDFEYFTFIPYVDGYKAVVSEPMMGSIAHSVVLVETPDAATAKEVAKSMEENADPRKWICVEAENVVSGTNGNIAILIMSDAKADKILETFMAVNEETMPVAQAEADVETEDEAETLPEEDAEAETPEADDAVENIPAYDPEAEAEADTPADTVVDTVVDTTEPEADTPVESVPETEEPEAEETTTSATIDDLYAIADKLYNGINPEDMPMVGTMELNEENFEYSAFVPYKSSYLAVESLPMMGSMPHSVVIVKADSADEAAKLAEDMKANANPRKWICVSAKSVKTASKGEYAILVMTSYDVMPSDDIDEAKAEEMSFEKSEERANIIINNFLSAV